MNVIFSLPMWTVVCCFWTLAALVVWHCYPKEPQGSSPFAGIGDAIGDAFALLIVTIGWMAGIIVILLVLR